MRFWQEYLPTHESQLRKIKMKYDLEKNKNLFKSIFLKSTFTLMMTSFTLPTNSFGLEALPARPDFNLNPSYLLMTCHGLRPLFAAFTASVYRVRTGYRLEVQETPINGTRSAKDKVAIAIGSSEYGAEIVQKNFAQGPGLRGARLSIRYKNKAGYLQMLQTPSGESNIQVNVKCAFNPEANSQTLN
jgi:hypothetical protein